MLKQACALGAVVFASVGCNVSNVGDELTAQAEQGLVRGTPVPVSDLPSVGRPYVVLVVFQTFGGVFSYCSGSYFAPRVVLTAAHCVPPANVYRSFVYWGSNFETDFNQIFGDLPAPGQPSVWAKADSWTVNPGFLANQFDADMAVVFLDRKPPFDPLPLFRNRLDASWTNRSVTLVGWGANLALSEDTSQNEGFGVKRIGTAKVLGTPTLADYEPTPQEVPLLTSTVLSHNLKLSGQAPNVNLCSGDSGGPIIVNQWGQDYIAGVASRTGSYCEKLSVFTRIDPYLPFLDESYRRGGQAPLVAKFDCVDTRPNGKLVAYFGFKNDNGVSVTVPYNNPANYLPLDVRNERPALFKPGENHFQFGIDFGPGQTVTWKLSPPNSPSSTVNAAATSPRCADDKGRRCARYCDATLASECIDQFSETWDSCITSCLDGYKQFENQCEGAWGNYLACVAATPPAKENWSCIPYFDTRPTPTGCGSYVEAALDCLYPPVP